MRRKLELAAYFIVILFFIVRYADTDVERDRRGAAPRQEESQPKDPAVLLPDGAALPRQEGGVVVELDPKTHSGVGTAFAVDGSGTYVTARHVTDGCSRVFFVRPRGGLEPVEAVTAARNRDFSVIRSERSDPFHVVLSDEALGRGSEGFMMGYPQGDPADVRATVIGRTEMRSTGRYRIKEPVIAWVERERRPGFSGSLQGISGGPVFDSDGNVVGTVVAGAPRRGRVYTTHPRVFEETGLLEDSRHGRTPIFEEGINASNYHRIGATLRASGAIKQVYCQAGS